MDLQLTNKTILVTGASSGLGKAVAEMLLNEGAKVITFARKTELLSVLQKKFSTQLITISGDVLNQSDIDNLVKVSIEHQIDGVFINAGGPPAKSAIETTMEDWDNGYQLLVRWKIDLIQKLIPHFKSKIWSRIILNESVSVKQPIANLALSNSLRLAMVGFAKTLSQEVAANGITINILAPGYHDTDALNRIFKKKSEVLNISVNDAKHNIIDGIPTKQLGLPENYASLAAWLFSPYASYITGKTISIDGGVMQGVFG